MLADCFGSAGIEFEEDFADICIHERANMHHAQDLFAGLFNGDGRRIDDAQVQIAGAGLGGICSIGMFGSLR